MLRAGRASVARLSTIHCYSLGPLRRSLALAPRHLSTSMPTKGVQPADLLARNEAWCDEMSKTEAEMLRDNAAGQNPSILWIGCSDSRVPESVVAKCRPGDIFTHRNIAGQFSETDDSAMSVLTYAVEALGVEHGKWCWCGEVSE